MNQILASPILQFCAILLTVGLLYCLADGRIDVDIWKIKITGKGGKQK
jgi:hypothetical protein